MADKAPERVTPEQIEQKLRNLQDEITGRATSAKQTMMPVLIGGGILLLLITYLLGKRVGKKKSTIVEIRRI
jgi:hypothetical protein